jgi:hypothetical protein
VRHGWLGGKSGWEGDELFFGKGRHWASVSPYHESELVRADPAPAVSAKIMAIRAPGAANTARPLVLRELAAHRPHAVTLTFANGFQFSADVQWAETKSGCGCPTYVSPSPGTLTVDNPAATCVSDGGAGDG